MTIFRLALACALLSGAPAVAHEFWIEPLEYQVESGDPIAAHLRNGENFKGSAMAWFDKRFTRFDIISGDHMRPVEGRMGDSPALQTRAGDDGLLIVVHETTESTVTYREWDKFLSFVAHKDFATAVQTHEAQGWPKANFREAYTRHVKSLIAVGSGAGVDRAFGLETEFISLTNPYGPNFDNNMKVELTYDGNPRPDAQIEVFDRAPDGTVAITLHRTDAAGHATIPVQPGHEYLFDAVVLRPSPRAGTSDTAPLWETLWAALTFAVPAE